MQFTAAAAALLLAPLAAAFPTLAYHNPAHNGTAPSPSTYENVDITALSIRETLKGNTLQVTGVESIEFKINGNTTCSAASPGTQGDVFVCGAGSPYRFGLINGTSSQYGLAIYKQTAPFVGFSGRGDVATYCYSGGASIEICNQAAATTIVIS